MKLIDRIRNMVPGMASDKIRQQFFGIPYSLWEVGKLSSWADLSRYLIYKFPYSYPVPDFPIFISLSLTERCNLSCAHCFRNVITWHPREMEMQLFEKIVDEVANHPECIIKLSGLGEPSLHPQIQDILSFLAKRKMMRQIRLYTNGNLFERFSPTEIIEFGVRFLIVSIDGIDAKSYEFIRVGGNYARLKANVVKLHQTREELKSRFPKIVIRHTIFPNESSKEIWQYSRDWIECADFVDFNHLEPLSPMAAGTGTPWFRHCRDIRREFYIGSGGRVPQCGNVFYAGAKKEVLSDLHNSTIQELWHNPTLQLLRSSHELGALDKVPFCKTCHSIRE